jgi:uncharacterized protein (TIGR03435 family)
MSTLAIQLSYALDELVVDQTGLDGRYSFQIDDSTSFADERQGNDLGQGLRSALRIQLGLNLERRNVMLDGIHIDCINPPSPN